MILSLDDAIERYLSIADQLQNKEEVTIEKVIKDIINNYKEVRVKNANIEEGNDMLLFQWGSNKIMENINRVDLRNYSEEIIFSDKDYIYLDFTRQIFAPEKSDEEFDDVAVQMSIQLIYGLAKGDEPNSNLWIESINDIDHKLIIYFETPFIVESKNKRINKMISFADYCG